LDEYKDLDSRNNEMVKQCGENEDKKTGENI
jgi:hypothetical protein